MTYTVQIPIDLKLEALSANGRVHWSVRKARTKVLRDKAHVAAVAAHIPPMSRAHLVITVTWPDRRRRDVANLPPTFKALIDGFVQDAGLLPDDDDTHLVGPDLRVTRYTTDEPRLALMRFDWNDLTPDATGHATSVTTTHDKEHR